MVFGFGKKERNGKSFKDRVTDFWQWYPQNAVRLTQMIETRSDDIAEFMSTFMDQTMPGLAWVFGPGESGGHSFTVSGEGVVPKQLLAEYWHSRAHNIANWTFHASRQATSPQRLEDFSIAIRGGQPIDVVNFMIQTTVDEESELIDIVAWHPAFEKLSEEERYHILFLLLDEALGEFGTEMWLGGINVAPITGDNSAIKLSKLAEKIAQVNAFYDWEKVLPIHGYSLYEIQKPIKCPRGDTLFGTTSIPNIVSDFIENKGKLRDNPLKGTGAEFAYVALDGSVIPSGEEVDARSKIAEVISEALEQDESGLAVGGAFGTENSYIDLIFFDGPNSEAIVSRVLNELQLTGRSSLRRFV